MVRGICEAIDDNKVRMPWRDLGRGGGPGAGC